MIRNRQYYDDRVDQWFPLAQMTVEQLTSLRPATCQHCKDFILAGLRVQIKRRFRQQAVPIPASIDRDLGMLQLYELSLT